MVLASSTPTQGVATHTFNGDPAVHRMIPGGVAPQLPLEQVTIPGVVSPISLVYSRSRHRLLVYNYSGSYSHQWPRGGKRFDGLYTPVERLRRRLRVWRLAKRGPCGWRFFCKLVSPMSNTVGGLDRRSRAADSGRAASINSTRIWASGAGQQRVDNLRPLSISFPSLSMGTSHSPSRQSREGFGGGLLKSR